MFHNIRIYVCVGKLPCNNNALYSRRYKCTHGGWFLPNLKFTSCGREGNSLGGMRREEIFLPARRLVPRRADERELSVRNLRIR